MVTCDECKSVIIDREYELMIFGEPEFVTALLCNNNYIKNLYYNGNLKTRAHVDAQYQPPILIGVANSYCRGSKFDTAGMSILDSERNENL